MKDDHVHEPYLTKTGTFCVHCDRRMGPVKGADMESLNHPDMEWVNPHSRRMRDGTIVHIGGFWRERRRERPDDLEEVDDGDS